MRNTDAVDHQIEPMPTYGTSARPAFINFFQDTVREIFGGRRQHGYETGVAL